MALLPADVRNKQFATTRLRPGYDEEEVDAFLDEVETELDRLLQENQELRAELAGCLGGGTPVVPALSSALTGPDPQRAAEPVLPGPQRTPGPALMGMPGQEPSMDTVARVLALAQQTADQGLTDARREAGETLGRARRAEEVGLTSGNPGHQATEACGPAHGRSGQAHNPTAPFSPSPTPGPNRNNNCRSGYLTSKAHHRWRGNFRF